jgi:hypothetical protein
LTVLLTLRELTDDYKVIVIHDSSQDHTGLLLDELARLYPDEVRIVHLRRAIFDKVQLEADNGVVYVGLMKKTQDAGFRLTETPVRHFHHAYGQSQFFNFRRLLRVAKDLTALWLQLVWRKEKTVTAKKELL